MNHAEFLAELRRDPEYRFWEAWYTMTLWTKIRYIYLTLLASLSQLVLGILNVAYHLLHRPEPMPQPPRWLWAESTPTDLPHVWHTCYACPQCGGVVTSGMEHTCPGGAD